MLEMYHLEPALFNGPMVLVQTGYGTARNSYTMLSHNMNMDAGRGFGITDRLLGSPPFLSLSKDEFMCITSSQQKLLLMLGIEEKFDALLQNYAEYEYTLLNLAFERSAFQEWEWSALMGDIYTVNRRFANVLTMARVYVDHTKQDLDFISGTQKDFTVQLAKAYDNCLGYRVMEALRNHMQHRAFAVSIRYPSDWRGDIPSSNARPRSRVVPELEMQSISENKDFKQSVLRDLEQSSQKSNNITEFLRQYVEQLGGVHQWLRGQWSEIDTWQQTITETVVQYRQFAGYDAAGIVAVNETDSHTWTESTPIFTQPIERLKYLRHKNGLLTNLSLRYVSSETS
jgi:hypothetical protein